MQVKNDTGLLHGSKGCSRKPPQPEMMFVVRGKYALDAAGAADVPPLYRSPLITDAHIESARAAGEAAATELLRGSIQLGQWSLMSDTYEEGDEARVGAPLYPGDFADFKLNAEVMVRASCYAPKDATECVVAFGVGDFEKRLRVVGHRVRTDDVAGGAVTPPKPVEVLAVDYAHAHGGPGFVNNPIGKGHVRPVEDDGGGDTELYQPPRSHRSMVMPARQLPNVLHHDGKHTKAGLPAGFGPLNPAWPYRADKLGKRYDDEWRKTRAPYFAADFDWRYFHCAPPDQQLEGYLRGDEELWFDNLHPSTRRLKTRLPAVRLRVLAMDDREQIRELPMVLDTVFADLEEGALYVTWRGHVLVREADLDDVAFVLVKAESMSEGPRPASEYEQELKAFAADPLNMAEAFPEGFLEHAKAMEAIETASDAEIEQRVDAIMATDDAGGPLAALMKMLTPPSMQDQLASSPEALKDAVDKADEHGEPGVIRKRVRETLLNVGRRAGSPLVLPLDKGEQPRMAVGGMLNKAEKQLHGQRAEHADKFDEKQLAQLDKGLERIRTSPLAALDPEYTPWTPESPEDEEPGPGVNLTGRDLSGIDLSGADLHGANLEGATLSRTNLRGADLRDARMAGVAMFKADLREANLTGADLSQATLHRVDAQQAQFNEATLNMAFVSSSDLSGADFSGATGLMATFSKSTLDGMIGARMALTKSRFETCSLKRAQFDDVNLDGCELRDCSARELQLKNALLHGSAFHKTDISGGYAAGAQGRGSVWMQCILRRTDFTRAFIPGAFFTKSEAIEAVFEHANIEDGRFDRANLRKANFAGAKLSHANLRKTVLTKARFAKASLYEAKIVEAAGTDVDFAGAKLDGAVFERSEVSRL